MFGRVGSSCMWMPRLKRCSWIASDACAQMSRSCSSFGIGPICATSQRRLDGLLQFDACVREVGEFVTQREVQVEDVLGFAGDAFHQHVLLPEHQFEVVELSG